MCGAVQFTATDVPADFGTCHCKMCQQWAGSALLAVSIPQDNVHWTGTDAIATIQSSDWAERAWCSKCGTGLWYRVTADGPHKGKFEIPLGLFDDPSGFEMTREIFIDRKPDAFSFEGARERLTEAQVFALYAPGTEGA